MIIDIVFFVGLAGMIVFGYKKGFVQVVSNIAKLVVAFILAYLFAKSAGQFIRNKTDIGEQVGNSVDRVVSKYIAKEEQEDSTNDIITAIERKLNINAFLDKASISEKLSEYIFTGIGFVAVYIIVRIVLWIVTMFLDSLFELPVLRLFNKTGGVIAAIVLFVIEFCIFLALLKMVETTALGHIALRNINSSTVTKVLYNHNLVVTIIYNKIL